MKGIAHFVTGVAVASFFPEIIHTASQHVAFGPVLGGLAGLLPDTLDFKFTRYFERLDDEIDPAAITTPTGAPDPPAIAARIAAAMAEAANSDKTIKIQLHTVRLGADLWRQWSVTMDQEHNEVVVVLGPVVTTSGVPYAGSEIPGLKVGRAQVGAAILHTYDSEIKIDVFDGPVLAFRRAGTRKGAVEVTFLPWHRAWSHSLLLALSVGGLGWLVAPVYGLVMALAAVAHALEDQLGHMGSNWLFPLTKKRTRGLGLIRSGDAIPNFWVVWVGLAAILLNLDRFSAEPVIPVLPYVLAFIALPSACCLGLYLWSRARSRPKPAAVLEAVEALDEMREVDI